VVYVFPQGKPSKDTPWHENVTDSRVEEGFAMSSAFHSLVERSIIAWDSLDFVGKDRAVTTLDLAELLRSLISLEALLRNRQFWFFQRRNSFLKQRLLMKWSPAHLDEYILLPICYGFVNNNDCFFVSHYWHTREHPDPEGHDMRLFREDLVREEWSYIWVDWTCMPQAPRNDAQQTYFKKILYCIPMLVRDCAFEWRFPTFEPRAWILFEVAEFILNHRRYIETTDIKPFIQHVFDMLEEGVRPVVSNHGYICTNGGDLQLVIGWLEVLVILVKIIPHVGMRQKILDWVNNANLGCVSEPLLGLVIDKARGVISCNGTTYQFTPVFRSLY
jgi:hypothetical protein